jgi:ProP effector
MTAATKTNGHDKNIQAVLELLAETWPAAFSIYEDRRRPLKIGIHHEILAALGGAITAIELRAALGCYVANPVYRARLIAGAARIGLDGQPAGLVTPEQIPPPAPTPPAPPSPPSPSPPSSPPSPSPSPPRRISLADLRAAAARRREQS